MSGIFIHRLKALFVYLLLGLVAMLLVNSSLYTHSHIDEYGQVIYHAHPFSSAKDIPLPLKESNHSQNHLYIFSHILILFIVAAFSPKFLDELTYVLKRIVCEKIYHHSCISLSKQRGPPHYI